MKSNNYAAAITVATAVLSLSGVARADINEPVEGEYEAHCEQLTLSAGIFETQCESTDSSLLCGADWVGEPFSMTLPCGPGALTGETGTVQEVYESCMASDLRIVTSDEREIDVTALICGAARDLLLDAGDNIEAATNGTFTIDVAGNTWLSSMRGTFSNEAGDQRSLGYATANFPWSRTFGFGMLTGVGVPFSLSNVCEGGSVSATLVSSGNVVKESGVLSLNYNVNGLANCSLGEDESVSITINLHADVAGQQLR